MNRSHHQLWLRVALLFGVGYFLIGRGFAAPVENVQAWRYAAWLVSGVAFATHLAYEHFWLRLSPLLVASHTALAVAIGALLLAVAGMIHSLPAAPSTWPSWLLALLIWPAATAIPAFLVALMACLLLRLRRKAAIK